METLKFKTNIKCGGCIAAVTPSLNGLAGIEKWEVDTANPEKILTVQAQSEVTPEQIVGTLKEKGYIAEKIS
ncbi:heavy-metal-associated domain-containing protein [Mucilaginibacter myungsuensis]|uniref:Heavy-metal-associated domain-containing protein n=1 Tax=Mucilaginibacter myungsuensis TaxID=649104 RepID=A0A929PWM0_9SPHI|nr:heavy metal-associated domain-containing protein [Mucilaginibacter myungsuensis]MBE9662973.1 heavy-metal-associated domain-containing protein [Mucilaginibacter myungsuensis]MDN3598601.1 heavy metal-associated domain-containing protein [Mucilaginibacter myungsuensis]